MNSVELTGVLEIIASERPDLLGSLVAGLEFRPAGRGIAALAKSWGVRSETPATGLSELAEVALKTVRDLTRLEKRRVGWRHPRQVVDKPNIPALHSFALRRSDRVTLARGRRLQMLANKLERAHEGERQRRMVEAFLHEPAPPVDPDWLRDFLGSHHGG